MDDLLHLLILVAMWPYETWKKSREDSILGDTEFNRKTTKFWWWFGIIAISVIVLIALAL